ncbi:type II secretion system major pseudopilin GspG [Rubritalea spongiae]|uniref:Type II secretion system core protein G n=1 Tax=Rubritalea spongiae TaxID=430797 RepID=A0ABW5E5D8_9BACT
MKIVNLSASPHSRRSSSGFTLLEMVMVMAIIAVLAGGVIGLLGNFGEGAKIQRAETDIKTIDAALMNYNTLAGRYPTTEQGLEALVTKPTTAPKPRRYPSKPFLKAIPMDPWGNPYAYKMPGSQDPTTYEVLSYGADGQPGGDDDISSQDPVQ